MAAIEQAGTEAAIRIPQAYRDYLIPRRLFCDLRLLGLNALAMALMYIQWRWGNHNHFAYNRMIGYAATTMLDLLFAGMLWRREATRPWQYVISGRHIQLIAWGRRRLLWHWHMLLWDREVISAVEEGEWCGLPALSLKTAARKPTDRRTYTLVYAHEDRERVINEIVPLIQNYRQRFRHEFWCEQFRSQAAGLE